MTTLGLEFLEILNKVQDFQLSKRYSSITLQYFTNYSRIESVPLYCGEEWHSFMLHIKTNTYSVLLEEK